MDRAPFCGFFRAHHTIFEQAFRNIDDILLMRSSPIAFSVTGKFWVNNHAHILKFEHMATQRFVEFYLESIKLDEFVTGAAQPKLNQKALNSIPILLPRSVDEQAKIVLPNLRVLRASA